VVTRYLSAIVYCVCISSWSLSAPISESSLQTNYDRSKLLNGRTAEAKRLFEQGEYEQSKEIYTELVSLSEKWGYSRVKANALFSLGILSWNLGLIDTAKAYFDSTILVYRILEDSVASGDASKALEIVGFYNSGKVFRQTNAPHLSIDAYEKAISLSRQINNKAFLAKCLRQLSLVYWDLKRYRQYYDLCLEALDIAKVTNNRRELSYLFNNIGNYYWKNDNYSEALKYYEKSLPLSLLSNNLTLYSICLNNIGVVYIDMGDFDKALDYCLRALDNDKNANNESAIIIDLLNIGVIHRRRALASNSLDEFNSATQYMQDCLLLADQLEDRQNAIIALNNLGTIYSDLNDFIQARFYFYKALHYADLLNDNENRSMILNNLGIIELTLGNLESSAEYFQKAIDIAQQLGTGQVLWEAYFELGNSYAKQEKFTEAFNSYKASISIIENIRSSISAEEYKASYFGSDKRLDTYYNAIGLLIKMHRSRPEKGYDREAFNFLERAKARAFLNSLEIAEIIFDDSADIRLVNQEKELMGGISKIYTKLLNPELSDEERKEFEKTIKGFEEELEYLKQEIRDTSPVYANLKYPEIITYNDVQNIFSKSDTTLFAFALGKDTSLAFAITAGYLKTYPLPSRSNLQRRVSEYRRVISDSSATNFRLGFDLFKELIQPGLNYHTKRLIIVPDDILHLLPFEALITNTDINRWLVEDYAISYVPSFSSLKYLTNRRANSRKPGKDLLAFGDPFYGPNEESSSIPAPDIVHELFPSSFSNVKRLRFSGLEVKKLSSLFKKSRIDIFLRQAATEEKIKSIPLTDYRILHFASHALIDDKKPARSAILLSLDQDPAEDGLLQTREIFNLKINADLVALSACQTGLGQFIRGEGIEGLNRAFFYAGSSAVLMSLWSVNDQATSRLMESFYHYIKTPATLTQALQKAKLEMIRSSAVSHPFYWASFVIAGDTDHQVFYRSGKQWALFVFFFVIGLGLLIFFQSRRYKKRRLP
jgi:CHAT domain-containing protein/Tfp pilus assembly protein PilF